MKRLRNFRLIPLVLMAFACFGVVKIASLLMEGGYIFRAGNAPAKRSWAHEMLNFPDGKPPTLDASAGDITGSVSAKKPEAPPVVTAPPPAPTANQPPTVSAEERAVLERLQSRRQELDARARELDIRESLLKAHEKRIQSKVDELKEVESRISVAARQKDEADSARLKSIVSMYESMKPKDAARIFDRLETATLLDVATNMKPQKLAEVLAQMQPDAAERLTVELARRGSERATSPSDLPKIEGRPIQARVN